MKYYFSFKIQYHEVDESMHLRLYTMENLLLNVAGRTADYLGYGLKYFFHQHLSWIITRLNLSISELPSLYDIITIETWIESNIHTVSIRDFKIYILNNKNFSINDIDKPDHSQPPMFNNTNFKHIGEAKSYWTVLNLKTRNMVNVFDQPVFNASIDGDTLNIPRISKIMQNTHNKSNHSEGNRTHKVKYSDIDYNMHCNSCKYIEMMLDTFVYDNFQTQPFLLEINYRKELAQNSTVKITYEKNDNIVLYKIIDENEDVCCNAIFKFS